MIEGQTRAARSCLAAIAVVGLAGCAAQLQTSSRTVETVQKVATQLRDDAVANASSASVVRTGRPRLAGEEVMVRTDRALPATFSKQVTYRTQAQSMAETLETVSAIIGLPIRSAEIADVQTGPQATPLGGNVSLDFRGTVRGLLDELAARSSSNWRYEPTKARIVFFRYETRTVSVNVPAGPKMVSAAISLAGVGGGGGGASSAGNVSVSQTQTVDPWSAIMRGVKSILSDSSTSAVASAGGGAGAGGSGAVLSAQGPDGQASASPELGIVTVTARPAAMERIVSYLESINARFAQNVLIDVKIYALTLDTQASAGVSLDAIYSKLNRYGVQVVGTAPVQSATGTPGQLTISSKDPNSRWNGSQIVAQALSQFGNVALQQQGQVLAINGQPSPIQVANEVNYIASTQTTQTANVGTTSSSQPGTKVVGFTANFIPLILGNNQILLNYQMQLSSLTAMTQISANGSVIQLPQIASQSLQQSAYMRDGEAIVLFGFDQSRDTVSSNLSFSSVSKAAQNERQMVVIVIQVSGGNKHVS